MKKYADRVGEECHGIRVLRFFQNESESYLRLEYKCLTCGAVKATAASNIDKTMGCRGCCGKRIERHGLAGAPEYSIWEAIVQRCTNPAHPSWESYGGRGITLHPEWIGRGGFANFIEHVGRRPIAEGVRYSIERIKNHLGYVPGNLIWATAPAQGRNKRTNKLLTYKGKTRLARDWASEYKMSEVTLNKRLAAGWSVHKALTTETRMVGRKVWARDRGLLPTGEMPECDDYERQLRTDVTESRRGAGT